MTVIDGRKLTGAAELRADLVVIGTGPAGASVVRELADAGLDILMVDAGGFTVDGDMQDSLRGDDFSERTEPLAKVRQKRVGGASMQWGGRTAPFNAIDFEARPGLGLKAWPVSREDMEPYYRRAGQRLDVGRFEWTANPAIPGERAHLLSPASDTVADEGVWRYSPPTRFAEVYRRELDALPNIRLLTHANVLRLVEGEEGRVAHAEAATPSGARLRLRAERFVLAAGGLESTRILLHSGIGNEHDQVGRNYMIHPIAEVGTLTLKDPRSADAATAYVRTHDGAWARRLLQVSEEVKRREGLLNMGFAIWYEEPRDPSHRDPLLSAFALARKALTYTGEFKATGMHRRYAELKDPKGHVRNLVLGAPALAGFAVEWARDRWISRRTLPAFTRRSKRGRYRLRFDAEQLPSPENRVRLSATEKDAYGVPRLRVEHSVSAEDRANYHRSLEIMAQGFAESGWASYVPPSLEELLEAELVDGTHQMGLLRMGSDPAESVVDADLKVWGTQNLYVSSTAVFPSSSHAGPTMTAVALSIRLADHLRTAS